MATKSKTEKSRKAPRKQRVLFDSNSGGTYDWLSGAESDSMRRDAASDAFYSAYDAVRFPARACRNSVTDPYHTDYLPTSATGASLNKLGLGMHPGRRDRGTTIDWERDLDADLERLWDDGVRTIVCMVEEHEFSMLGVPRYIQDAEDAGIDVIWFPVRDVSTPVSFRLMHKACYQVWEALKSGNVLVHCRGGKGRSGTLACCFLSMLGYSYLEALKIVRSSRKGTVETVSQERWCHSFARYMDAVRREAEDRD